uniref:putative ribonucleoside diphosphate reductase alpha subunit n=1 Tax=Caulobacter phage CcrColossus TaxID=1211640 RepID=UPI00029B7CA0|nr:putative ribonucleoside diphosphate reductase alpha subunit [Caulobacter phage CcrColossus]
MAVDPHLVTIDLSRDSLFDEFTLQTFRDRYLIDGETSPQHAFARASAAFADDADHAQRLYDAVSKGWFMFATPLLSNGGTSRGLPISCFLSTAEDSREGIFDHWTETGWLSSVGGGVGGYWPLRSNGTKTSQGSSSTGVIPFIAAVDRIILSVSQGGTRRGSYAAYMDIDHPEVMEFITGRKPTGGDENRKFINLHNALCITDKFMEAVRDDAPFDLVDPKSKEVVATHSAREMWKQIMETRKQTGEPYMFFVDVANRGLPEPQKKKGLRVNQSNLCTEITLATGRDDQGKKRTAVCCLSSVNAEKFDEWVDDPHFIEDLMRMLDNCLQVFIDNAPPALAYAIYSATQERSVGLGLLGFHAYLQKHMIRFESHKARNVNRAIFKHIRTLADAASLKLGAERGEAPDMIGTGERFAHKMAIAPNASSSILCGNTSPSIEPWRANAYLHKTLSGSFPVKNPFLVRELAKLGLDTQGVWKAIIANEGSVQGLGTRVQELGKAPYYVFDDLDVEGVTIDAEVWENLLEVFKTFTELDMRWVVQLARDRQGDIDQAQSVNTAFPHDADAGYMSEVHYLAWDPEADGDPIKSLYYYRSTTPKRAENTNEKVERAKTATAEVEAPTNGLSANPLDDSTCIACEG